MCIDSFIENRLFIDSSARADHSSSRRPNANPRSAVSKSYDVRDVGTGTNGAVSDEGLQARLGEMFRPKPTLCHQILGRLLHDRVPQAPVPFASRRNGGFSKDGQQSHPRLRNEPPHFVENALLVVHSAPSVCHADGEIKLRPDGKAGGVPGHEVQPARSPSTTRFNDIRVFVVHSYAGSETIAQHGEVASGAAPHIDYRHPFDDDVVEQVNLGLQERADFGWLRRWIKGSIQQAGRVDVLVGH